MARPALYERIADELRRRIAVGDIGRNDKLPTETDLCAEWTTSRTTVRQALGLLVEEGLVESHGSAGWFVRRVRARTLHLGTVAGTPNTADPLVGPGVFADPRTVVTIGMPLAGDIEVRGRRLTDLLDGVAPGDGVFHRSVLHTDGMEIVGITEAYAPEPVVLDGIPAFRSRTDPADPIAMFRAAGRTVTQVTETSAARLPTPQLVERLELRPATPVMHLLRQVRFAPDNTCLLVVHQVIPGAGAEFVRSIGT